MIEKVKYINHVNDTILIGQNGVYLNYSDIHDYSWKETVVSNRISSFTKGITTLSLPITICCASEQEGLTIKNRLMEVCEKDVLARKHGKLIVGSYYLKCFVTGSKKTEYLIDKGVMNVTLTITTDQAMWIKETTISFSVNGQSGGLLMLGEPKRNFDFNFDFPFDYMSEKVNKKINNTGFVPSNFRLVIYGSATNPSVTIGGHEYTVNGTVESGEYLKIDSVEKTVQLIRNNGQVTNMFNNRDRDSYIFEKIPSGENSVLWSGDFGFDVTLLEERSEPKWI